MLSISHVIFSLPEESFRSFFSSKQDATRDVKTGHDDCYVIPSEDCRDTHEWRKKIIAAAEHNIVISGNYCGGAAFDELLQAIDFRMSLVPSLKVVIIFHPKFVKDSKVNGIQNLTLIKNMQKRYGNRLSIVHSPDGFFGNKRITNHTKCTVVDYGRYFIQGGSGIKDNFVDRGLLHDLKRLESSQRRVRIKDDMEIFKTKKSDRVRISGRDDFALPKKSKKIKKSSKGSSFVESLLPESFRDQDFVFQSTGDFTTGKRVYREALFLALKWNQFQKEKTLSPMSWDLEKLGPEDCVFSKYSAFSDSGTSVTTEADEIGTSALGALLQEKIPSRIDESENTTLTKDFEDKKASKAFVKTFFTGPEDAYSDWEINLIDRINNAKDRIIIDHMYFHPSKRVMESLVKAANRNVPITVITACVAKHCSVGEKFFGHRNLYNLHQLFFSVKESSRKNIEMYKYSQAKNGLHKKVIVIDDFVLAGSSNLGTKSLLLTGDHEMNFESKSKSLAEKTIQIIEQDKKVSEQLKTIRLSFRNKILATFHNIGAFWWG